MAPRTTRLRSVLLAATVLVSVAACGGDDGEAAPPTSERTTTTLPAMPADFDWWHAVGETPLGRGWILKACEGDDPSLCYEHSDGRTGVVNLFRFSAPADFDLNQHAAKFVEDFRADRQAGCGEKYRVTAEPIEALQLADGEGRRYGFAGGAANGPDTERTIQWTGVRDGTLVIVTLSGYDPGSCVSGEGEGTLAEQSEVLDGVDALVRASGLPDPAGP